MALSLQQALSAERTATSVKSRQLSPTADRFTAGPSPKRFLCFAAFLGNGVRTGRTHCAAAPKRCAAVSRRAVASVELAADDLLVIGPGVLGSYAGKLWLESHPGCKVAGQTNTETNHPQLRALGLEPCLKPVAGAAPKFSNVLFSAPPSGSEDYVGEVKQALERWNGEGGFVFTSSGSVFAVDEGDANEDSPLVPVGLSEKADRLLLSEQAVLEAGGSVVRLVGLYHATRGAHTFFLKMGEVKRWGGYRVNLIHYEDAASIAVKVLTGSTDGPYRSKAFVGCDGSPISFQDMMDAVIATGKYEGSCTFTGEPGAQGKNMSNEKSRQELQWEPKYSSFSAFMAAGATDFYSESSAVTMGAAHQG
mmetsp:Transcript_36403/g.102832  ORF Transcript_36403/g.102832 Transcript_36403/m.102832 type:complete len:364 (-) Transcript_36403:68-1159(-)